MHDLFAAELILRLDTLGDLQRFKGELVVAGVTKVVLVDMHRMREAEGPFALRRPVMISRGVISKVRDDIVKAEAVEPPAPGCGAAGVDALDTKALRGLEEPGDIGCRVLDFALL